MWLETGRGEEAIKVNTSVVPGSPVHAVSQLKLLWCLPGAWITMFSKGHVYALQGRNFTGPSLCTEITPNDVGYIAMDANTGPLPSLSLVWGAVQFIGLPTAVNTSKKKYRAVEEWN